MVTADLARLEQEARGGNALALEQLLAQHRETVFRYGLRFCKSTEDTEDAVQETLWAATKALRQFRGAAALTTWLFTIVRNKCHRLLFRHPHDDADLAELFPQVTERSVEDELVAADVSRQLAQAMSRLESSHREALLLRDVEGLTAPEAADHLKLTVPALKSRLHRAREALRTELLKLQDQ